MHLPVAAPQPTKLFLDSADRDAVLPWLETGLFAGVTTNPKLLHQAGWRLSQLPQIAAWVGDHEVFFQVWGDDLHSQQQAADTILELVPSATLKVPCTPHGARLVRRLSDAGIRTLLTAVYSAKQMYVAAAAGATYVAPYFNRAFLAGRPVLDELERMAEIAPQDGTGPMILAASIKSAQHMVRMTSLGVRYFTISPDVAADLFEDSLTAAAVTEFNGYMTECLDQHP